MTQFTQSNSINSKEKRAKGVIPVIYLPDEEHRLDFKVTTYLDKSLYARKPGRFEKNLFLEPLWIMEQTWKNLHRIFDELFYQNTRADWLSHWTETTGLSWTPNPFEFVEGSSINLIKIHFLCGEKG